MWGRGARGLEWVQASRKGMKDSMEVGKGVSRRGEGHKVVRKTPAVSHQPTRQVLSASVRHPPRPASSAVLGTSPEPNAHGGELPGTPTFSPHLPEGLLPLQPRRGRSGSLVGTAVGPRRVRVGESGRWLGQEGETWGGAFRNGGGAGRHALTRRCWP